MRKNKITFLVMELLLLILALFFVWKIFNQNVPEKRVAVVLPEAGDNRWDALIKGMKQSAKNNHIQNKENLVSKSNSSNFDRTKPSDHYSIHHIDESLQKVLQNNRNCD